MLSEAFWTGREALQLLGFRVSAFIPTRFWQAHLKHFCWAHLAHIIHIRHIPPFGMGYLTLCCQSVATLGRVFIANCEGKIKQIRFMPCTDSTPALIHETFIIRLRILL